MWEPPRKELLKLKQLTRIRKQIIRTISGLKRPLGETAFMSKEEAKTLKNSLKNSLTALKKDLEKIDKQIDELIKSDSELSRLFKLVSSVKGVGRVTAILIIVATNEFKNICDAKKFACYSGVAPFEHTSGTSVNGRAHVSNMADKSLKCALHMAALAAISHTGELQDYFYRKVEQGKNKMAVINAVRNKLIHRVFACVRENRLYQMQLC